MQESKKTQWLYSNGFFCLLIGFVLTGILFGTISYCFMNVSMLKKISVLQSTFLVIRENSDFVQILVRSFFSGTVFLVSIFLLGFSAIAQPVEMLALLIRGMGIGVTVSQLYGQFGKKGIVYAAMFVLPGTVVSVAALAAGAREAVGLSGRYFCFSFSDRQEIGLRTALRYYATKFIVLEALLAVSAGVDCVCTLIAGHVIN